jgi:ADP-heptose:LPS heptosyltransferase
MDRILAIQLKRIGDLVLTRPALGLLRARWPDAEIAVAVDSTSAPVLDTFGLNLRPVAFHRVKLNLRSLTAVAAHPWGITVDFTGNDRASLISLLSRSPRRLRFATDRIPFWARRAANEQVTVPVRDLHTSDYFIRLLQPLGVPTESAAASAHTLPPLQIPESARASVERTLEKFGIVQGTPFLLIHPGSAREEKYWSPEGWARVADSYVAAGWPVVLSGGSAAFERAHNQQIASRAKVHSLVGKLTLLELVALIARAHLILSCDTAVVHFAAALRRPQLALFGPTNPFHWRPLHPHARVISAAEPHGPLTRFLPKMRGDSMDRIQPGTVIEVTNSLLASIGESR